VAIGIDLGTTYSLLSYLDAAGRPISLPSSSGDLLTPSAVIVDEDDIVVGREAVKASAYNPDCYAECFKRDMGRVAVQHPVHGHHVPPEVLSAFVLERLKRDAEKRLGPVSQAVITVPAYFDEMRRKATQDAGKLAGWEVLDIINEPTAAAMACGWERGLFGMRGTACDSVERVLVYDLGGGTFDVSLLEISADRFRTLATDGDVRLGGKDFDQVLVDHMCERFLDEHGLDPRSDAQDLAQLWRDAQDLKHALSEHSKASTVCFHAGIRMKQEITRQEFCRLTAHLMQRTLETSALVVEQAGLTWDEVDRVMVVGGATRMPMVTDMLRQLIGKEPDRSMSADEAVSHGAALYAGMLLGYETNGQRRCELINVNSHSLGVVGFVSSTGRRVNAILIPRNTPIPTERKKSFITLEPNQKTVAVPIVEGESERPEFCASLGKCVVRNLPPGLPKGTPVEVTYRYALNGRVSVTARMLTTGQVAEVEIERERGHINGDLPTWRQRLLRPATLSAETAPPKESLTEEELAVRKDIIQQLDNLYCEIGRLGVSAALPNRYEAAQKKANAAAEEVTRTRKSRETAEQRRAEALSSTEAARLSAEVSKTRLLERQAETNCRFAYLVLGREIAAAGLCPSGSDKLLQDTESLRRRLAQR
jgi:molecular chaperone DnaK